MAIVKQYNAKTDTTYLFESISYWDDEKKQSRSKRKLLGKLDPETGEIVPTGPRGRKKKVPEAVTPNPEIEAAVLADQRVKELTQMISIRDSKIAQLESENNKLKEVLLKIEKQLGQCSTLCSIAKE